MNRRRKAWRGPEIDDARGRQETSSALHEARLDTVLERLRESGARSVIDLGCGAGALLRRLAAEPRFHRIAGVDSSARALLLAQELLATEDRGPDGRVTLYEGSVLAVDAAFADADVALPDFDAAVLIETIEHLEPGQLSKLERGLFARLRPGLVIVTTPNREYNVLHGVREGAYRHPDHRFEWDRSRFEQWSLGVAGRNGYRVEFEGIGPPDARLGSSTQLALFRRGGEGMSAADARLRRGFEA